jgi:anti-sigma factor RsiW
MREIPSQKMRRIRRLRRKGELVMRCQEALVEMSAALDGEIDPASASSLQQHVGTCEPCRTQQEQLQAVDRALRAPALRLLSVPEELRGRIASELARPQSASRRRSSPLAFAVAFTGAAAAAAAMAMARPSASEDTTSRTDQRRPQGDMVHARAPVTLPGATSARTRSRPSGSGNPCRLPRLGPSPVALACAAGGTQEAKRVMRTLVDAARARGMRFECRSCHRNEIDFALEDGARQQFARLLAAAGA